MAKVITLVVFLLTSSIPALAIRLPKDARVEFQKAATATAANQLDELQESDELSGNPYPSYGCPKAKPELMTDKYLRAHGNEWPSEGWAEMLKNRQAENFYNADERKRYVLKESNLAFCPSDSGLFGSSLLAKFDSMRNDTEVGIPQVTKLLENATKHMEKNDDPVVFIDMEWNNPLTVPTLANTLCSLKRTGLLHRTIVFSAHDDQKQKTMDMFPEATFVQDEGKIHKHFAQKCRNLWRWAPILAILEQGHSVLHLDPDVHMIKDPRERLLSLGKDGADVVSGFENCYDLQGGTNFFRSTEHAKNMLRRMLAMEHPKAKFQNQQNQPVELVMDTGDQWALTCAAAHGVEGGMKLALFDKSEGLFDWRAIHNFFSSTCNNGTKVALDSMPLYIHTSGTADTDGSRVEKMKVLGLLEYDGEKCQANFSPAARCNAGMSLDQLAVLEK